MRSPLKNQRGNFFIIHPDLNQGPLELKATVLPISYADPGILRESQAPKLA